jgi:hypothetical protein
MRTTRCRWHNSPMPPKPALSAIVRSPQLAARSSVWTVDTDGRVMHIESTGHCTSWPLHAARPTQVVVSASHVWARAEDGGVFLLEHASAKWTRRFRLARGEAITGARDGGVWVYGTDRLRLVGVGASSSSEAGSERCPPFRISALNQGHDNALWALDDQKRFGGRVVWRCDLRSDRWRQLPPPAAAMKIAGRADGTAWALSSRGELWRLHPEGAGHFAECRLVADCRNCLYSPEDIHFVDVQVGADDSVWVLRKEPSGDPAAGRLGRLIDYTTRTYEWLAPQLALVSIAADGVIRQ